MDNNKNGKEKKDEIKGYKFTSLDKKRNLKPDFIENLKRSMNNVTVACKNTNISRETYYRWLEEDEEFRRQCKEVVPEQNLDFVESKLFELINGISISKYVRGKEVIYKRQPDVTAVIFYLKTKGKKRGYIEKTETDLNLTKLPDVILKDAKKNNGS
jgi:hypothetical protein